MNLADAVTEIANAIVHVDRSRVAFKGFQPGVGPHGEPQLVKLIAARLNEIPSLVGTVSTKRTPDLLIRGSWAMEFKIVRPYGDNGREAESWSVNLLHPYVGNISSIADCWKLENLQCAERKAIVVIGYEHTPAKIDLTPLVECFEIIARQVARIQLSPRIEIRRDGLVHPVHQAIRVFAWEVLGRTDSDGTASRHPS